MSEIRPFNFPVTEQDVRVVDRDGEPWFVAADVCAVLRIAEPHRSVASLDDDEKGRHSMTTPGGAQQVTVINESGLYSLILRSRKAEAKAFKRWVTHDVLPAIRRTGGYARPVDEPYTYTWDEATTLIRQRYGVVVSVPVLTRALRAAGILRQNGVPKKAHQHFFWFTGTSWTIHPHAIPFLTRQFEDVSHQLREFRFIQARLELDGVTGEPPNRLTT